jgi:ABC-type transport system substrate-binding protein
VEWTGYATQVAAGEIPGDLFFYGAGGEFFCQGDLADWYGKSGWAPGKWLNAGFDTIFEQLISTVEPEERQALCSQLQQYMYDEVPLIFLYFQVDYYGLQLNGFVFITPSLSSQSTLIIQGGEPSMLSTLRLLCKA